MVQYTEASSSSEPLKVPGGSGYQNLEKGFYEEDSLMGVKRKYQLARAQKKQEKYRVNLEG